jgi:hypothetical protein
MNDLNRNVMVLPGRRLWLEKCVCGYAGAHTHTQNDDVRVRVYVTSVFPKGSMHVPLLLPYTDEIHCS